MTARVSAITYNPYGATVSVLRDDGGVDRRVRTDRLSGRTQGHAIGTRFTLFVVPVVYLLLAGEYSAAPAESQQPAPSNLTKQTQST